MRKYLLAPVLLLLALAAQAQMTVTLTPSVTQGDGSITTSLTWSTNPPLTTGTPCTASGDPMWTGPKAGSGGPISITILASGTLTLGLTCNFPGDSIATTSWTNPTKNTDNSNLTNLTNIRLKYTFNAALTSSPTAAAGETIVDVPQTPTPLTVRTITGIASTGTFKVAGFAQNALGVFSDISGVATKMFTGNVPVTQSVMITVNPKPQSLTGIGVL